MDNLERDAENCSKYNDRFTNEQRARICAGGSRSAREVWIWRLMGRVGNEPGPHRFRHTYATDLFRRGVRLEVILLYDAPRATGEM